MIPTLKKLLLNWLSSVHFFVNQTMTEEIPAGIRSKGEKTRGEKNQQGKDLGGKRLPGKDLAGKNR